MLTDIDITYQRECPEWAMGYSKSFKKGSIGGQIVEQEVRFEFSYGGNPVTWESLPICQGLGCRVRVKGIYVTNTGCDACSFYNPKTHKGECVASEKQAFRQLWFDQLFKKYPALFSKGTR